MKTCQHKIVNKTITPASATINSLPLIRPKLFVSHPNTNYEYEANETANRVMDNNNQGFIQTKLASPLFKNKNGYSEVDQEVSDSIFSTRGQGERLDNSTNSFMSSRLGADLSNIKIHNDSNAVQLNRHLNAKAFTVGNDVYFNQGTYAPHTAEGSHLLAHELSHTIQQGAIPVAVQRQEHDDKTFTPKPEIDFKLLPPNLQIRLYHFLLEGDTSNVHLDYQTKTFMAGLSYSYGDALSLKLKFSDFTSKLGWTPGENAFSLGVSHGSFSAGLTAKPWQSSFGLGLTYGAPLMPMQGDMSKTFMAGGASAGNLVSGLPGIMNDPMAWYTQNKGDIENISETADMVKKITGDGKSKIRFGASFSISYDPQSKLVIGGRAGFIF